MALSRAPPLLSHLVQDRYPVATPSALEICLDRPQRLESPHVGFKYRVGYYLWAEPMEVKQLLV